MQKEIQHIIDEMRACRHIESYDVVVRMFEESFEPMLNIIERAAVAGDNPDDEWAQASLCDELLNFINLLDKG